MSSDNLIGPGHRVKPPRIASPVRRAQTFRGPASVAAPGSHLEADEELATLVAEAVQIYSVDADSRPLHRLGRQLGALTGIELV